MRQGTSPCPTFEIFLISRRASPWGLPNHALRCRLFYDPINNISRQQETGGRGEPLPLPPDLIWNLKTDRRSAIETLTKIHLLINLKLDSLITGKEENKWLPNLLKGFIG